MHPADNGRYVQLAALSFRRKLKKSRGVECRISDPQYYILMHARIKILVLGALFAFFGYGGKMGGLKCRVFFWF